ncbi:hypothetical protein ABZX74_04595 [Streptomyces olivaceoviridis]
MRGVSPSAKELTQATVDDLPARLGPGDACAYLPGDLDPRL